MFYAFNETEVKSVTVPMKLPVGFLIALAAVAVVAPVFMFISNEVKSGSVVVNGLKEFSFISFCGATLA